MSQAGAGPSSPGGGVVKNSALEFVASPATQAQGPECMQDTSREQMGQDRITVPAGLKALCEAYSRLYPDQPNPLQVTTRLKYWLGGHDPLDYISMYWNPGKPEENIPPHWHYVSFGLSDLHGDGRVHLPAARASPSGFGLELSMRLHADGVSQPPLWPAALLQALARYMFTTGNKFMAGDHISWHAPLEGAASKSRIRHLLVAQEPQLASVNTPHGTVDFLQFMAGDHISWHAPLEGAASKSRIRHLLVAQEPQLASVNTPHGTVDFLQFMAGDHISWHAPLEGAASKSRIRHLLVAQEPQLASVNTPHGTVDFLQMVGCTGRELKAAQRGSGFEVLKLIGEDPRCGAGSWLVTRANRRVSAVGARVSAHSAPAQLAGVSARLHWTADTQGQAAASPPVLPAGVEQQIKDTLQRGLSSMSTERTGPEGHMSTDSFEMSSMERALPIVPELMQGSWRGEESTEYYDGIHILFNAEGASLLPLAIDGRVRHGRHFTWREGGRAITLLPPTVDGAIVTPTTPYASRGAWLQVLIPKELAQDMSSKVSRLSSLTDADSESDSENDSRERDSAPPLPLTLTWPEYKLKISVLKDHEFL